MANFTSYACRAGGSNLNAGTRTGNTTEPGTSANFTYASGNWVSATGVFTVASGNPQTDGVAVGDFASVYADGSTVTTLVGRVTAVSTTTITVSTTAKSGSTTDGTGNRTLKIGGAWAGPSGTSGFPITFLTSAATNSSGDPVRINLKNDQTYSVSAAMTTPSSQWKVLQGYSSSYGDGGRAVIDGGTAGAAYTILTFTSGGVANVSMIDVEIKNNGATGGSTSTHGLSTASLSTNVLLWRCVFHDLRASGVLAGGVAVFHECEFYNCNQSNTSGCAGLRVVSTSNQALCTNCFFHDNTGSNTDGIIASSSILTVHNCVFDSNGHNGITLTGGGAGLITNCDFYNNGTSGIDSAGSVIIENCNFTKNATAGITQGASGTSLVFNSGYGAGTEANGAAVAGAGGTGYVAETGAVTYGSNLSPWVDAANGDFRINLAAARGAGRGAFLQTASSYAGAVGYPDIGAAQSQQLPQGPGVSNVVGGAYGPIITE